MRLQPLQRQLAAPFRKRINRAPSPVLAYVVPWLSVMLGSVLPGWIGIASAPTVPPMGYLLLLGWRQLRPGLLPVWAGLPLGFVDDLYSGQPMGSAVLLWSVSMLVLDAIELRFPWRNFLVEWMVAAGMLAAYLLLTVLVSNAAGGAAPVLLVVPQLVLAVLVYPVVGWLVGRLDRLRLFAFMVLG